MLLKLGVEFRLALEHGVEPLDGGDADPAHRVEGIGGQVLDIVKLSELPAIIRSDVLLELHPSLASQIAAVNQKKHPLGVGKLDEPVDRAYGGECFATA